MQMMTEQLTAISLQHTNSSITGRCFKCGKSGHFARNCRTRIQQVQCFNCGGQGHIAQNHWKRQGNGQGVHLHVEQGMPRCELSARIKEHVRTIHNTHSVYTKCCCLHQRKDW